MSNPINKKLADILGKMDDKMLQVKLNNALDMIRKGSTDNLAKKISKIDKEDLIQKIDEFDISKLDNMKVDKNEVKNAIDDVDMGKLKNMIGDKGDEIIERLMDILDQLPDNKN